MEDTIPDRRATRSERNYIAARLRADGITPNVDPQTEPFDIPVVIVDLEIMRIYDAADERMSAVLQAQPVKIELPITDDAWAQVLHAGQQQESAPLVPDGPKLGRRIPLALVTPLVFVLAFVSGFIVAWGVR